MVSYGQWNVSCISHGFSQGRAMVSMQKVLQNDLFCSLQTYSRTCTGISHSNHTFPFSMTLKSNDWQLCGTMLEWTLLNKETFSATTSKYLIAYWCCYQINKRESFPGYSAQGILMTLYKCTGLHMTSSRNCNIKSTSSQIVLWSYRLWKWQEVSSFLFLLEIGGKHLIRERNYTTCTEWDLKHVLIEKYVSVIMIIICIQVGIDS